MVQQQWEKGKNIFQTFKNYLKWFFDISDGLEEKESVINNIKEGVSFRGTNILILILAMFIASLGLNVNSTAVIIGAMLISPLMGPIIGMGLGLGIHDMPLIKRSFRNLAMAALFSIIASTLYFLITPLSEERSELLARTSPTIYDVLIAFFGGCAGILALSSKQKGNVLPGVAIATALMPPLCTAGYGLATLQFNYFLGAFYLFLINSIFIGLCMGSGAVISIQFGAKNQEGIKRSLFSSLVLIGGITLAINIVALVYTDSIIQLLQTPSEIEDITRNYLLIIFAGISSTFLYNYYAFLLRAVGNSVTPLAFLAISTVLNIGLDLLFIPVFGWGVAGAAAATVISQFMAGIGICISTLVKFPQFMIYRQEMRLQSRSLREITSYSTLTCVQQSIMNFGILLVQGLVNSFGTGVMAAFAAAVKIDSFAYMPVQDFGNAFSTFIAQNFGAGESHRVREGIRAAFRVTTLFCLAISLLVFLFARPLMRLFINGEETAIIATGVEYLRVEGSFYVGIGYLFLLYGYYRAVQKPGMSVILTFISLGTRVLLAYTLAAIPAVGVQGIWWSIPIGWALADIVGVWYFLRRKHKLGIAL